MTVDCLSTADETPGRIANLSLDVAWKVIAAADPKLEKRLEGYYPASVTENLKITPPRGRRRRRMQPKIILPKKHPLHKTFAVGPNAKPETQRMAAEVVGFELGQIVTSKVLSDHYQGNGPILTINPADREVLVDLDGRRAWFRPTELAAL